jgi:hypothetical protein
MVESKRKKQVLHVERKKEMRNSCYSLVENVKGRSQLFNRMATRKENIKCNYKQAM